MAFKVPTALVPQEESIKYCSGYSKEEEDRIKSAKALIDKRDLAIQPVTLEEFRTIIAPWYRINRTDEFILRPEKVKKIRVPKEPKEPKAPKVKKLTKAQIQSKLQALIMKLATRQAFTEEEIIFYKEQTGVTYENVGTN